MSFKLGGVSHTFKRIRKDIGVEALTNKELSCLQGTCRVQAVDEYLRHRDSIMRELHHNLSTAQNRMKFQADQKRRKVTFTVVTLPHVTNGDVILPQPKVVIYRRVIHKGKYRPKSEVLIKWKGARVEDATWENEWRFQIMFKRLDMARLLLTLKSHRNSRQPEAGPYGSVPQEHGVRSSRISIFTVNTFVSLGCSGKFFKENAKDSLVTTCELNDV
nr:adaptin ear-binding coat-associated protein, putative [Tanacetum cinerariifolium]